MHKQELAGTIVVTYDEEGFNIEVSGYVPTPEQWAEMLVELIRAYRNMVRHGK